ncbi:MAG: transporter substrate-binding protein [Xanthobacteraceae bacterium]|jgi:tripartite-type tricarboxylate transporter receptor subunit TctC|nr:transporter substrate-binding protein [Xanthobacteraceae bacterium]
MNSGKHVARAGTFVPLLASLLLGVTALPVSQSNAQDYPSRQITLIVPSPAGGGTDTQARVLAPKLSQILGQTIVIDNRGGASGNIGAAAVAKAPADGYTLLAMISSHVINPYVLKSTPYELDRDFAMISRTVTAPGVLVGTPSLPAKNLTELMAYLKTGQGNMAFASGGKGSLSHLIVELFQREAGVKLLHVPYRGTHPAMHDVVGGQVALMVPDLSIALGQISGGQLRAFGVTGATRVAAAPEIPTIAEAGLPGFNAVQWFGLAAPAGTPPDIVKKLHAAVKEALNSPDVQQKYKDLAMSPEPSASPEEYAAFVRAEGLKWGKVVKDANIVAE